MKKLGVLPKVGGSNKKGPGLKLKGEGAKISKKVTK
jgi:hypothetical protein